MEVRGFPEKGLLVRKGGKKVVRNFSISEKAESEKLKY